MKKPDLKGIKFEDLHKEYQIRVDERRALEEAKEKSALKESVETILKQNNLYPVFVHRPPVRFDVWASSKDSALKELRCYLKDDIYVLQEDEVRFKDLRFEVSKEIKSKAELEIKYLDPIGVYNDDFYDLFCDFYDDEPYSENILDRKAKLGKSK